MVESSAVSLDLRNLREKDSLYYYGFFWRFYYYYERDILA